MLDINYQGYYKQFSWRIYAGVVKDITSCCAAGNAGASRRLPTNTCAEAVNTIILLQHS